MVKTPNIVILTILVIALISVATFIFKAIKEAKSQKDPIALLKDFSDFCVDLIKKCTSILDIDISKYPTEDSFKEYFVGIIADEFIEKSSELGIDKSLLNRDLVVQFVDYVFYTYKDELEISELYEKLKDAANSKKVSVETEDKPTTVSSTIVPDPSDQVSKVDKTPDPAPIDISNKAVSPEVESNTIPDSSAKEEPSKDATAVNDAPPSEVKVEDKPTDAKQETSTPIVEDKPADMKPTSSVNNTGESAPDPNSNTVTK